MKLILTQEGIERIWEFYQDPYLTDEESEVDSILRRASEWGPKGFNTDPFGSHQPPKFPGPRSKGPYPFEKEDFIISLMYHGYKDRQKIERILSGLYDVGYIENYEGINVHDRPHGKIGSKEHTKHWYGDLDSEEWTGRLKEIYDEKGSAERWEYIKRLYPDRFPEDF